ncbi:outer membrane beta-barrel protein [Endozoicomonadaceae bacterium StTr2]
MLKPIATALIASTVLMGSSTAFANDWFIGGTAGKIRQDFKLKVEDNSGKGEQKDTYISLKAGKYINDNIRIYANIGQFKDSGRIPTAPDEKANAYIKNRELSFSMDYVDNFFNLPKTKYFFGGTLGINRMNTKVKVFEKNESGAFEFEGKKTKADTGLIYGAQLGLIQQFTPAVSAEIGYRYAKTTNKVKMFDGDLKIQQKAQKMPYMSISYHFF